MFRTERRVPEYEGRTGEAAEERARARGVQHVRIADWDQPDGPAFTADLQPDRLNLLIHHGRVSTRQIWLTPPSHRQTPKYKTSLPCVRVQRVTIASPDVLSSATLTDVRFLDRLGLAQRIVMVVGLGLGMFELGQYLMSLDSPATFGWFGYAPLTQNAFVPAGSGLQTWQRLLIWLGLILVWSVAGVVILRPRRDAKTATPDRP
jgi:hypothetical protein